MLRRVGFPAISITIGIVVSLSLLEVLIRIVDPQDLSGAWRVFSESGLFMNKSWGTAQHVVGGRSVLYTFDWPGLRSGPRVEAPPPGSKVLVLGDSFTFGWGLSDKETFVALLEQKAVQAKGNEIRFLNAASGGWGLDSFVRYVEEFGESIGPCLVLVFLNTDDIGRAFKNGLYRVDGDVLLPVAKQAPLAKRWVDAIPMYGLLIERSHLIALLRKSYLYLAASAEARASDAGVMAGPQSGGEIPVADAVSLGFKLVERLAEWFAARSVDLLVLTTGWHRPPYDDSEPTRAFMRRATDWFAERAIPFADISHEVRPKIDELGDRAILPGDGHPSPVGAALIAHAAWQHLSVLLENGRCAAGSEPSLRAGR
jgi:lysophospholipase L1-like esterase